MGSDISLGLRRPKVGRRGDRDPVTPPPMGATIPSFGCWQTPTPLSFLPPLPHLGKTISFLLLPLGLSLFLYELSFSLAEKLQLFLTVKSL